MRNYGAAIKSVAVKTLVVGGCLAMMGASAAFAAVDENGKGLATRDGEMQITQINEPLLPAEDIGYLSEELKLRHQEIDRILFEEHKGDFSDAGFNVAYTGPNGEMIEVGIYPYEDKHVEYLNALLGEDQLLVVEGEQAFTMMIADGDMSVSNKDEGVAVQPVMAAAEPGLMVQTGIANDTAESASANNGWLGGAIAAIAAAALGAAAFAVRKLRISKK